MAVAADMRPEKVAGGGRPVRRRREPEVEDASGAEGIRRERNEEEEKRKNKKEGKIENGKKNGRKKGYFGHFTFLCTRRSCFAKRYTKLIQLHQQIRFTSTATTTVMPNTPLCT
jgi:flagellar biosynthesis/type III secretory pathway protein FliH